MDFFDDFFYPRQTLSLAPSFYYPNARPRYRVADFSDFFDEDEYEVFYPRKKVKPVRVPQLHLAEEKKGWVATVLLPGVTSFKDIVLDLDEDLLRIRAEVRGRYQRQTYAHSLLLPHGSDKSQIRASFKGETLTVVIPRMAPEQKVETSTSSENKPQEPVEESSKKTENSVTEQKPAPVSAEAKQQQAVAKRSLFMMPKVSHRQTETHNVIAIEFPENWAAKEDLDVEVSNSLLNISFVKKENGASFTFRRSVSLPPNATEQDITAKFENNTLLVSYPKPTPPKTFKIPLSVGDSFQQEQLDSSSTQQPEQQPSETSSQTAETSENESGDIGSESTTKINLESSETEKEPVTVESA